MPASIRRCARQRDRDALRGAGLGRDQRLCSDHTPVDDDGKQMPFDEAESAPPGSNCCCR
jgi:dihydroorotase